MELFNVLTVAFIFRFVTFLGQCQGYIGIGFVDSLVIAIDSIKSAFTDVKQGVNDDAYIASKIKTKKQPSILNSMGICSVEGVPCDYLQCLTENFRHGHLAANAKKVGRLMVDPDLRHMILTNEAVLQLACNLSNLNQFQCLAFKEFLNLMNLLDPPEAHINDEPRDKRSADKPTIENSDIERFSLTKSNNSVYDYYDSDDLYTKNPKQSNDTSNTGDVGGQLFKQRNCTELLPKKVTAKDKINRTLSNISKKKKAG